MSSNPAAPLPAIFDPISWVDLLTVHTLKRDMFSAKSLMAILEGIEQLNLAHSGGNCPFTVTMMHATLFERLQSSFNNPALLKSIGTLYLGEFRMPGVALKHFELAHQYAPKDREIESLKKAAALSLAREATETSSHSGVDEAPHAKPLLGEVIRKTTRLNGIETRTHLGESSGEFTRKQQAFRKTGEIRIMTAPTTSLPADFSAVWEEVQNQIVAGDFDGASANLIHARSQGAAPEELQAFYADLGLATFDKGLMQEALDAYGTMRDLKPEALEGWFNCGLVYQKMGLLDEALSSYQEAARLAPDNSKTWCNLSSVWFERGDYEDAEKAARKSIELRPDYARAWDNLASTLSAMDRLPEAAEACQQAIRFQPALHSSWFKLGVIHFQQDNLVSAMEAFSLTGDSPDYFSYVLYYLCMIEARRGKLDLAMQKLAQARLADPANHLESSALREIGSACTKFGRDSTAAEFYGEITARHPDDFSAWIAKGTAHHRVEQFDKAREAYRRAADLEPANPTPWHNLGLLASDEGNHEESRQCFQREVELSPDDPKAWYDLAVSLQTLGREEEGQAAYERSEKLVKRTSRRSSDLSAAMSIVRRLNLGDRVLKSE